MEWEAFRSRHMESLHRLPKEETGIKALQLFHFQARYNPLYARYLQLLNLNPSDIQEVAEIPFLPIELFKRHSIRTGTFEPEVVFTSSGTTRTDTRSRHEVRDSGWYARSFLASFQDAYGSPGTWVIAALLPSYQDREGSSLIHMVSELARLSGHPESGFYLGRESELLRRLVEWEEQGIRAMLFGVTFALLDLAERHALRIPRIILMETGGMKGRREELTREEVHERLMSGFRVPAVHSEYGMTEMLSQAYSPGGGIFHPPAWMQVLVRDPTDPLARALPQGRGGLNVIDLANVDSCAFLATSDLGQVFPDGSFSVDGRFDNSDVRGCNLLLA